MPRWLLIVAAVDCWSRWSTASSRRRGGCPSARSRGRPRTRRCRGRCRDPCRWCRRSAVRASGPPARTRPAPGRRPQSSLVVLDMRDGCGPSQRPDQPPHDGLTRTTAVVVLLPLVFETVSVIVKPGECWTRRTRRTGSAASSRRSRHRSSTTRPGCTTQSMFVERSVNDERGPRMAVVLERHPCAAARTRSSPPARSRASATAMATGSATAVGVGVGGPGVAPGPGVGSAPVPASVSGVA